MESARAELLAFLSKADPMDWRWGIYDEGGQRRLGQAAANAVGTILESSKDGGLRKRRLDCLRSLHQAFTIAGRLRGGCQILTISAVLLPITIDG